jgi:hypothetical protein
VLVPLLDDAPVVTPATAASTAAEHLPTRDEVCHPREFGQAARVQEGEP